MSSDEGKKKKFGLSSAMEMFGDANNIVSIFSEQFDEKSLNLEEKQKQVAELDNKQKLLWEKLSMIKEEEAKTEFFKALLSVNEEKVRLQEEIKETIREAKRKYNYKKVIKAVRAGTTTILPKILDYLE